MSDETAKDIQKAQVRGSLLVEHYARKIADWRRRNPVRLFPQSPTSVSKGT